MDITQDVNEVINVTEESAAMLSLFSDRIRGSTLLTDLLDFDASFSRGEMTPGSYINAIRATMSKIRRTLPMDDR